MQGRDRLDGQVGTFGGIQVMLCGHAVLRLLEVGKSNDSLVGTQKHENDPALSSNLPAQPQLNSPHSAHKSLAQSTKYNVASTS